ncbi:MAG: class I SAM-dependent methyltransferase [Deltaproteobacteria bacterium]|nr:class I SAM-dependent methyltransferase [Deltaproteobacteria bacterium]
MSALYDPKVQAVLERLFAANALQEDSAPALPQGFSYETSSPQERADAMSAVYMPISKQGGQLLYSLVRSSRPEAIVEFGTSFGISTIYLACALVDSGKGHIFGTELSAAKAKAAHRNLLEAGLADKVTILQGDALETLTNVLGPIGLALLDGWKDMNLAVLKLLEPRLAAGALIIADDSSFETMTDYLHYVRDRTNGYVSVSFPVADGMEISCRTGG